MRMLRYLLAAFALCLLPISVQAAARFAVCTTTCTWDASSTAMWSASSGGATGASVPGVGDTVTLDAATCVGGTTCTITVNTSPTISSLTMGACTASTAGCILDFSVNNLTASTFSATGTGTRTLMCGTGTFHITAGGAAFDLTTVTNATISCSSATLSIENSSNGGATITTNGQTFGALVIGANSNAICDFFNTAGTFGSVTVTAPVNICLASAVTQTWNGGFSVNGTSSNLVYIFANTSSNATATIAAGSASTCQWCVFKGIVGSVSAITATNSFNLSTGVAEGTLTISPPSTGGGGGFIIGGG